MVSNCVKPQYLSALETIEKKGAEQAAGALPPIKKRQQQVSDCHLFDLISNIIPILTTFDINKGPSDETLTRFLDLCC